ncbi:MAG: hypothetical protein HY862_13835 [Chloroflexi bacterium]|nr:hypothetical protein [Chloroflexota bacterium]
MAKKETKIPGGKIITKTDDTKMQGSDMGERIIYRQEVIEKSSKPGKHVHSFYEVRQSPGGQIKTEQGSRVRNDKPKGK